MSRPGGIASSAKAAKPPNAVKTDNITRKLQHLFARNPVNGGVNINNTYVEIKLIRISIQGKIFKKSCLLKIEAAKLKVPP